MAMITAATTLDQGSLHDQGGMRPNLVVLGLFQLKGAECNRMVAKVVLHQRKRKLKYEDSPTLVKLKTEQRAKVESCSPKQGQISGLNPVISESNLGKSSAKTASVLMESRENVVMIKQGDSKPSIEEESNSVDGVVTREMSVSTKMKSVNLDVAFQDSTVAKDNFIFFQRLSWWHPGYCGTWQHQLKL